MPRQYLRIAVVLASVSTVALAQEPEKAPSDFRIGIGVGYAFPDFKILEPNSASVIARFGRLSIEPALTIGGSTNDSSSSASNTVGTSTNDSQQKDALSSTNVSLSGLVRYDLASVGPLSLLGIGGISAGYSNQVTNRNTQLTNQVDRTSVSSANVGLAWGLAIEWAVLRNLVISANATNPLVGWARTSTLHEVQDNSGSVPVSARSETVTAGLNYGLTFAPSVRLMVHLYF